jgi:hypothetical protein
MPHGALKTFEADPDALVRRLSAEIDDAMIADMAALDYGRDIAANAAALRDIRDSGRIPAPLPWVPREVLELTRWWRPDLEPLPADRRRGHRLRAFACAALLKGSGESANRELCEGQNQTVVRLLTSLDALDDGHEPAAIAMLFWLIGRLAPENRSPGDFEWYYEDRAFLGVAILWLGTRTRPRLSDAAIVALAEWLADSEHHHNSRRNHAYGLPPGPWLLGSTSHDQCHDEWRALGRALAAADLTGYGRDAADWLRLVGSLLAGA